MSPELSLLLQFLGPVGAAVGVYAAIRSDLARLHERTQQTKERADHAHERIDGLLMGGKR